MSDRPPQALPAATETILFLLIPDFSMIAFTSAIEPLRIANRLSGRRLYEWRLVSRDGAAVPASNAIAIQVDGAVVANEPPGNGVLPTVVLCGGLGSERYQNKDVFAWLRRWDRRGAHIGALCTGAHVLARAGLLDRHRCTIHWENLPGFVEAFPEIPVSSDLYEIDRNRFTCSGGTAALDLMLHRIALAHGDELATKVSEQCIVDRIRGPHDRQRMPLRVRLGVHHPKLIRAVEIMEGNIEEPLEPGIAGGAHRPLPPPARAPVPAPPRPHPRPILPRDPARARAQSPVPDRHADHERRLRHRLRLGLPLHDLLPADVREDAAGGAGAGGVARSTEPQRHRSACADTQSGPLAPRHWRAP